MSREIFSVGCSARLSRARRVVVAVFATRESDRLAEYSGNVTEWGFVFRLTGEISLRE